MFFHGVMVGAATLGVLAAVASPATAGAADLSCSGNPATENVSVDGEVACGAKADASSAAFARALDAVAFARAEAGGHALGFGFGGAVAAAETVSGQVGALAFGPDAVSIVSPDVGARAVALSLARGQTFVGTAAEGVRCDAGAGLAFNFTTGQICVSDGTAVWTLPPSNSSE